MSAPEKAASRAIATLTGVRGFAALWVVLYHVRFQFARYYPEFPHLNRVILNGYFGLDLFALLQQSYARPGIGAHDVWSAHEHDLDGLLAHVLQVVRALQREGEFELFELLAPYGLGDKARPDCSQRRAWLS